MTRSLAAALLTAGTLTFVFGTGEAEARHGRRNRCCVNYGWNQGYAGGFHPCGYTAPVVNAGCCQTGGTWNPTQQYQPSYPQSTPYQSQPTNNAAPPPPVDEPPEPRT
jgi:hypothetical protein